MKFSHKKLVDGFSKYFEYENSIKQQRLGGYDKYFEQLKKHFTSFKAKQLSSKKKERLDK
ncbi:MAG: hypothetical protein IJD48_02920 [Clostridia bacterium]|nr:hypothetical protein [Clostridia bacterium]